LKISDLNDIKGKKFEGAIHKKMFNDYEILMLDFYIPIFANLSFRRKEEFNSLSS
jgi:hypothetical protein